jgi:mannose-1-phosphate guanylyltransferase
MMKRLSTSKQKSRYALILAGGDGTRLRSFTRAITGDERPKQFAPVIGGQTLLDQTRRRVGLSISEKNTFVVVTKTHEQFYQPLANTTRLLVQPENKGTAPGIIFPLLRIAAESPNATVAIFPSDHYFTDDQKFMSYVETGLETSEHNRDVVTLLGISPDAPETDLGWIEPELLQTNKGVAPVRRFWEKPSTSVAQELMERGCLWNSFVMVGSAGAFLKMIRCALPELFSYFEALVPVFGTRDEFLNLRTLYAWLRDVNFSKEVLEQRPSDLRVIKVDNVGWSDLGDPSRVGAVLRTHSPLSSITFKQGMQS